MRNGKLPDSVLPWSARLVWIAVLAAGSEALDGALDDTADTRQTVVRVAALVVWVAGVAAMAVPSVWSLTATRTIVPTAVPAAIASWVGGASTGTAVAFAGTAVVATVVVLSADLGRIFVQASAYGEEDRHPLRPSASYLSVAVAAWITWAAVGLAGAVAATRGPWWLASLLGLATVAGMALGLPRWNRLARRWLVLVPIGLVVHDELVLAETMMLRRQQIARIGLARAGTEAADLTGPAAGHALEIRTGEAVTVVVSSPAGGGGPKAIHLTGCLVAPSRPGKALAAAARRGLPVGAI